MLALEVTAGVLSVPQGPQGQQLGHEHVWTHKADEHHDEQRVPGACCLWNMQSVQRMSHGLHGVQDDGCITDYQLVYHNFLILHMPNW